MPKTVSKRKQKEILPNYESKNKGNFQHGGDLVSKGNNMYRIDSYTQRELKKFIR